MTKPRRKLNCGGAVLSYRKVWYSKIRPRGERLRKVHGPVLKEPAAFLLARAVNGLLIIIQEITGLTVQHFTNAGDIIPRDGFAIPKSL